MSLKCDVCGRDPGLKEKSRYVWNGFQDADTGKLVCYDCRQKYYEQKTRDKLFNLQTGQNAIPDKTVNEKKETGKYGKG